METEAEGNPEAQQAADDAEDDIRRGNSDVTALHEEHGFEPECGEGGEAAEESGEKDAGGGGTCTCSNILFTSSFNSSCSSLSSKKQCYQAK